MFAPTDPTLAVDIHHLIPRKWSRVSDLRDDLQKRVDRLANLAPLAKATNILTGNREPASYIELFAQGDPGGNEEGIDSMLSQHLVEPRLLRVLSDAVSDLDEHVERFLDDRLANNVEEFKGLVGAV